VKDQEKKLAQQLIESLALLSIRRNIAMNTKKICER